MMYTLDSTNDCIRYTSTRSIKPDEELCIFYGHKLWFDPVNVIETIEPQPLLEQHSHSGFLDILATDNEAYEIEPLGPGDPNDILESDALPFVWKKLQIDEEEETIENVRTSKFNSALQKLRE